MAPIDTLWYTRCPVATATCIATHRQAFEDEFGRDGIGWRSLRDSADKAVWESHFDHKQKNSFREGGNIPPLWARSNGNDVRLIGLHWADHKQVIMAGHDSGIQTVKDLRGRRFGIPRRKKDQIDFWAATGLRILHTALDLHGIPHAEVEVVDLEVDEPWLEGLSQSRTASLWETTQRFAFQRAEYRALASGKVDATFSTGFRAVEMIATLGATVVIDLGTHPDPAVRVSNVNPVVVTASGALCDDRPDLVARYLVQLIKAADIAAGDRAYAMECMGRETISTPAAINEGYGAQFHTTLRPELEPSALKALESQKRYLLKNGFIAKDFAIDAFVDARPLEMARAMIS